MVSASSRYSSLRGPVHEVPVEVDVVLVDAAHPREPVGVQGVDEQDRGTGGAIPVERRDVVPLQRRTEVSLDAVRPGHHDDDVGGLRRPDLGDVDRQLLAVEAGERMTERLEACPGRGGGVEEGGAGIGIGRAERSDHRLDRTRAPHDASEAARAR